MGKPKYIESPERMWELFQQYVIETKGNPFLQQDFAGKDASEVERKKERPLTMEGFENFLFKNGIISDVSDYFECKKEAYKDYFPICRAIKRFIRQDQIEGGMAGIYNPSITQRLNGLVDRVQEDGTKEVTIKVKYEQKGIGGSPEPPALGTGDSPEE
jgi:hypothetical protein